MPLRFGLFGTGDWARDVHAAALHAEPDAELVGVWGRNGDKTRALASELGIVAYDDRDALIGDVEAVCVALPPDVQAEIALRAAERGRHLLLEKPLALDVPTANRVVDAVAASGVRSVVFFTLRFAPASAQWLRDVLAQGPPDGLRATWFSSLFHADDARSPDSPWRRERGALWDVGPHALSLALPLLGPVSDVRCVGGQGDTVHLTLRHEAGGTSTISLSLTVPPASSLVELGIYGTGGWQHMPAASEAKSGAARSAVRQLIAAVRSGEPHPCDVDFARNVVAVLQAAQRDLGLPAARDDRLAR